jgi:hypothetical protein
VTWYYGATREVFAAGKAALDALFEPDPHFLGPREPGVARALAETGPETGQPGATGPEAGQPGATGPGATGSGAAEPESG